ncbi:protein-tyrosine-phosphatase PTP1-like [Carex rostrata]
MDTPYPSTLTPTTAAISCGAFDPCSLATDAPLPRPKLSLEQLKQCSEALSFFEEKVKNRKAIAQEFSQLETMTAPRNDIKKECTKALGNANKNKNRYMDVLPYDNTRVILNASCESKDQGDDFINANFVTVGPTKEVS